MTAIGQFPEKFFPSRLNVGGHRRQIDGLPCFGQGLGLWNARGTTLHALENIGDFRGKVIDTRIVILLGLHAEGLVELDNTTGLGVLLKKIKTQDSFKNLGEMLGCLVRVKGSLHHLDEA